MSERKRERNEQIGRRKFDLLSRLLSFLSPSFSVSPCVLFSRIAFCFALCASIPQHFARTLFIARLLRG